jgi:hypothetical protein
VSSLDGAAQGAAAAVPQLASTHLCYRLAAYSGGSSCAVSLRHAAWPRDVRRRL